MELKTIDEILAEEKSKDKVFSIDPYEVYQGMEDVAKKAAKVYAHQAVRLALETCAEKATTTTTTHPGDDQRFFAVDKSSILSLADGIIGKLK